MLSLPELRVLADELPGLDLPAPVRDAYLNQSYIQLCVRSGWSRRLAPLTVADPEADLDLPSDFRALNSVTVDSRLSAPVEWGQVEEVRKGRLAARNVYALVPDGGRFKLRLAPLPSKTTPITIDYTFTPQRLTDQNPEPIVPPDFCEAIAFGVVAVVHGLREDALEELATYRGVYEREIERLAELRNSVDSSGVRRLQLEGVHF